MRVPAGSACQEAQSILVESRRVGAFHHISLSLLLDGTQTIIDSDVLILGENRPDANEVQALAERIPGVRGAYAGRLRNAHQVESFTANLISVNRRYKTHAGVRITNV